MIQQIMLFCLSMLTPWLMLSPFLTDTSKAGWMNPNRTGPDLDLAHPYPKQSLQLKFTHFLLYCLLLFLIICPVLAVSCRLQQAVDWVYCVSVYSQRISDLPWMHLTFNWFKTDSWHTWPASSYLKQHTKKLTSKSCE